MQRNFAGQKRALGEGNQEEILRGIAATPLKSPDLQGPKTRAHYL
jgi:hypothetical protein